MRNRVLLLALALQFLAGCVTAPVQELSDARQAVSVAERVQSPHQQVSELTAARQALSQAEESMRRREFKRARQLAIQARDLAMQAQKNHG